jgi:hypothetical protein
MALARVVSFEHINPENVERIRQSIEAGDTPEGMPPAEVLFLHDKTADTALAIVIVENEDDYRRVDDILGNVPADEAAGRRTSVTRYEVTVHTSTPKRPRV